MMSTELLASLARTLIIAAQALVSIDEHLATLCHHRGER